MDISLNFLSFTFLNDFSESVGGTFRVSDIKTIYNQVKINDLDPGFVAIVKGDIQKQHHTKLGIDPDDQQKQKEYLQKQLKTRGNIKKIGNMTIKRDTSNDKNPTNVTDADVLQYVWSLITTTVQVPWTNTQTNEKESIEVDVPVNQINFSFETNVIFSQKKDEKGNLIPDEYSPKGVSVYSFQQSQMIENLYLNQILPLFKYNRFASDVIVTPRATTSINNVGNLTTTLYLSPQASSLSVLPPLNTIQANFTKIQGTGELHHSRQSQGAYRSSWIYIQPWRDSVHPQHQGAVWRKRGHTDKRQHHTHVRKYQAHQANDVRRRRVLDRTQDTQEHAAW